MNVGNIQEYFVGYYQSLKHYYGYELCYNLHWVSVLIFNGEWLVLEELLLCNQVKLGKCESRAWSLRHKWLRYFFENIQTFGHTNTLFFWDGSFNPSCIFWDCWNFGLKLMDMRCIHVSFVLRASWIVSSSLCHVHMLHQIVYLASYVSSCHCGDISNSTSYE